MRKKIPLVLLAVLLVALTGGTLAPGESVAETFSPAALQLELPDLGDQRYAPGVLRIPEPEKLRQLDLHIPLSGVFKVTPKINALGTGLVMETRARKDETVCHIDLSLNQRRFYALSAADNTVEVKVVPKPGADPLYAKWVIAPPKEPQAWQAHQQIKPGDGSLAQAEMSKEGLVVLEELEDGSLNRLDHGITTAKRIFFQARFPHREESVSLSIHWMSGGGEEKTFSVGSWKVDGGSGGKARAASFPTLEGDLDLALGQNQIEVEVKHGYDTLSRSTYRIYRRALSTPTAVNGEKWAVVIGISDYQADGMDLRFADHDAEALRDFLMEKAGFRKERVRLLENQGATSREIRTALSTFLAGTRPEDLVLLFVAGHGMQDTANPDNFYLLAHDSELGNPGGTAIMMPELGSFMDYLPAQRTLVFADTCHSGAVLGQGGMSDGGKSLNFFNKYLETLARKKGRLVVTASQAHENSLEASSLKHGVFTNALLRGLGGDADDSPADGVVTAGELIDYLRVKVPEETAGEQHPSYSAQEFDMNLPLAYVRREKTSKH